MNYAEESLKLHYEWKGKIEVVSRAAVDSKEALSLAYTQAGYYSDSSKIGAKRTKYIQVEDKTASPAASAQDITPTEGKLLKKVHINAVDVSATASESDVLSGKTFFSGTLTRRTGTATVPTVGQDSTTKVLTIS